ncbi:zinc finger BED domain-containing protein 1-like, partial [Ceratina calcarata]|uniref:Zinc finger BED domain-containing protein 1-like n=1 Tax=Ceratina calcarata TaxID=156304 RepID=A0AAJ7JBF2_9HYME
MDIDGVVEPVVPETLTQQIIPVASTPTENTTKNSDLLDVEDKTQVHDRELKTEATELQQSKIIKLHNFVVTMICQDLQPLSIVDDKGFIELLRELEPRYQFPSRNTLRHTILPQVYKSVKDLIMKNLQQIDYVSITTDLWTNLNKQSYLTVTSHYCLRNKSYSNVLATKALNENHTSEYITHILRIILSEFQIYEKTVAVVTDNAANMKDAVLNLGYLHLPFKYFKTDVAAAEKLTSIQTQFGLQTLKLKLDVSTKWKSSLIMLERLVGLKVPVSAALKSLSSCSGDISNQQWEIIDDIISVLQPIEYVSTKLSAEKFSTASKIIPFIGGIENALQNIIPKTRPGLALKINIIYNIERRFVDVKGNKITTMATIIDPRFKTATLEDLRNADTASGDLKTEVQ